jgi:hypothetical protein
MIRPSEEQLSFSFRMDWTNNVRPYTITKEGSIIVRK